jgi:hypothetical protein
MTVLARSRNQNSANVEILIWVYPCRRLDSLRHINDHQLGGAPTGYCSDRAPSR